MRAVPNPNPNPNPNPVEFSSWIKFLYKNQIFDRVLTDILLALLIFFLYLCAYAYLKIRANSKFIRENWSVYRCNPSYMPFAGMVMQPTDMSQTEYTQLNFEHCFQNIMNDVAKSHMTPLYYTQSLAGSILSGIASALNSMRELINNVRTALASVMADIMSRILNIMQPIVIVMIKLRDSVSKMQGIITAYLYTIYGTYLTLVSGLKSVFHLIVIILIAMGAAIVAVWIAVAVAIAFGPFGIPAVIAMTATGIALTAVYIAIAIPMGIIANFLAETMKISGLDLLPSPPKR
jgi:hypothetical protein